jgi:hypothetical protein
MGMRVARVLVAALGLACSTQPAVATRPAGERSEPKPVEVQVPPVAVPRSPPDAAIDAGERQQHPQAGTAEACHLRHHIELGFQYGGPHSLDRDAWEQEIRRNLLSTEAAKRSVGPTAERAIELIAERRFPELAAMVDPRRGVCLRAAKGASCRQMSARELAACGSSRKKEEWSTDTGADSGPKLSCRQAFAQIFFTRDFRKPDEVLYNCFPYPGRGNNSASLIGAPSHQAYVDFHAEEVDQPYLSWRSLWLVFDVAPGKVWLTEITAEYWGI